MKIETAIDSVAQIFLECHGNGKLPNDSEDVEICPKCGGFGFIKREKKPDNKETSILRVTSHPK